MSLTEAAAELGLTRAVLWRYVRAERLAAHKVGRIYVIPREELDRFKALPRLPGRPKTKRAE